MISFTLSRMVFWGNAGISLLSLVILPFLGGGLSNEAENTIMLSIAGCFLGYIVSTLIPNKRIVNHGMSYVNLIRKLSLVFMLIGAVSFFIGIVAVGGPPLILGNEVRVALYNSPYWSPFVLGQLGLFFAAWTSINGLKLCVFSKFLIFIILFFSFLSGGKGPLLLSLLFLFALRYKDRKFKLASVVKLLILICFFFVFINSIRVGGSLVGLIQIPYYLFWGYQNFSDIAFVYPQVDCLYTVPISSCEFTNVSFDLADSTWNVYSALMPIYLDGGNVYVFLFFLFLTLVFFVTEKTHGVVLLDYIHVYLIYFLMMSHNGYMFNSGTLVMILFPLIFLEFFRSVRGSTYKH